MLKKKKSSINSKSSFKQSSSKKYSKAKGERCRLVKTNASITSSMSISNNNGKGWETEMTRSKATSKDKSRGKIVIGNKLHKKGRKNLSKYLIQQAYLKRNAQQPKTPKCDTPITSVLKKLNMKLPQSPKFQKIRQKTELFSAHKKSQYQEISCLINAKEKQKSKKEGPKRNKLKPNSKSFNTQRSLTADRIFTPKNQRSLYSSTKKNPLTKRQSLKAPFYVLKSNKALTIP